MTGLSCFADPRRAFGFGTILALLAVLLPGTALASAPRDRAKSAASDVIPGRYIVVYRGSVQSGARATDNRERDLGFKARQRYGHAVKGFAASLSPAQVRRLQADPKVAAVVPDRVVHATAAVPVGTGETVPTGVRRMQASTTTSTREASSVGVAIIDTGVDLTHPDLNVATAAGDQKNCMSATATANDDNGHGSHVSGTIAARNGNGSGVVGVAPGTQLYAVKVLDSAGSGTQSSVICGIDWVTANAVRLNIKVANMSLGGLGPALGTCASTTDPEHKAICNSIAKGVTYVVAAGNSGYDYDYAPQPDVPAAYPEVLTVSAVSDSDGGAGAAGGAPTCRTGELDDKYASFSNYAATAAGQAHTIAGPGVCIYSTWKDGGFNTISGTSMATPHLVGAVALCLGEGTTPGPCAGMTPAQIIQKMRSDAQAYTTANPGFGFAGDPTRPVSGHYYGYLDWAGIPGPPPAPTAPTATTGTATAANTTATLRGTVNPGNQATTYHFEYGTSTSYGTPTTETSAGSGGADQAVSAAISGLEPGTTYHFKIVATNASSTVSGADASFTTSTTSHWTAAPTATAIQSGTLSSGTFSNLATENASFFAVNSTRQGTRTTAWYGTFSGLPSSLSNLKVSYTGKNSRACSQTIAIFRWADSTWVSLDTRSVGTTSVRIAGLAPAAPASAYMSAGSARVRVRCTTSANFTASGDWLALDYDS